MAFCAQNYKEQWWVLVIFMATRAVSLMETNKKKVFPIVISGILESYDVVLYGLLAPVFAKIFFPDDFKHSLLAAFLIFSISFFVRPFGAVLWGYIGDKYGRKVVLITTLTMMSIVSAGMACVPTYQSIGIASTIIILLFRLIQGLAFSGELPTIMVMLYEVAPDNRKATYSSLWDVVSNSGLVIGILIITLLHSILDVKEVHAWGWRLCFGISVLFTFIIGYIRISTIETKPQYSHYSFYTLRHHWKNIIKIMLYMSSLNFLYYTIMLFNKVTIFKNSALKLSDFQATMIHFSVVLVFVIMLPIMGFVADKIGLKKSSNITLWILIFISAPLYYCLVFGNIPLLLLACFTMSTALALLASAYAPMFLRDCPIDHRISILGIAFSLSILIGSFTPSVNEALSILLNTKMAPVIYFILSVVISLIVLNVDKIHFRGVTKS